MFYLIRLEKRGVEEKNTLDRDINTVSAFFDGKDIFTELKFNLLL